MKYLKTFEHYSPTDDDLEEKMNCTNPQILEDVCELGGIPPKKLSEIN